MRNIVQVFVLRLIQVVRIASGYSLANVNPVEVAGLILFPIAINVTYDALSHLVLLVVCHSRWLLLVLLLLNLDLHEGVRMIFVEISRTQRHLGLLENIILFLQATHLMVLDKEIPVLGLPVSAIDFLLEAHGGFINSHQIIRMGHAVVAWLPWTTTVCRRLVEVILSVSHRTAHFHGGLGIGTVCEVITLLG